MTRLWIVIETKGPEGFNREKRSELRLNESVA
jgi:hypothetical protein